MSITLIGLGIREGDLTLLAKRALDGADVILARTSQTESFKSLNGYNVQTLDSVFMSSRNFDTLNKNLAREVVNAGKTANVCYCVDGAVSDDEACKIVLNKCKNVTVHEGVSRISHVKNLAKIKCTSVTSVSAYDVRSLKSCRSAIVFDIDDDYAASEVKIVLSDLFGEETTCAFVRGGSVKNIKIYEIDRQKTYGIDCAVAVEEGEFLTKDRYDFADLVHMVELLRAPGGCPWDRAQTNASIKGNVVEEAYELADAIERDDDDGILEEVGDVLLQAAFHSVLKSEQGVFNSTDAATANVKKLIFRHSHIFGKDKASSESEALGVWDKNKLEEKHMTTFGESVMAVPKNFPACMRAQKVGKRAGKSGMDFLSPVSASEKLWEEVKEMVEAMQAGDKQATFDEAGDVLFAAVNTCRLAGVDCEEALRAATEKFAKRFVECEKLIIADGKNMTDMDELELDYYWVKAKNALKKD
ncbi:MAG: nucleoside triphosphate pyrophosphohydrolase [Clostridia bacterium]|nr:nucleoside triphosphate pyrophosphohydrolase [Clostridia bacterium]